MARFPLRPVRWIGCIALLLAAQCSDSATLGENPPGHVVGPDSLNYALRFASYLGGSGTDMIRDAALDPQGNIYVAGSTRSPNFPTTPGALQPVYNQSGSNDSDGFITKFDPNGNIVWSTFLGGPGYERVYGIEVDEQGFVYVAGRAGAGFPVTPGAFQTIFGGATFPLAAYGPNDGFVCKIRPDGTQIVFCSYFGNDDFEPIRDLAIDSNHDIYVATSAVALAGFPGTWFANAYQKTIRGGRDALIAKIKGDGSRVEWATLLGGSGEETNGISIRVDATGVYTATTTGSADMPTPNGFGHTLRGTSDVFLAKLSLDGSTLLYGTYVGGSGNEATETHHIALDTQGNAYLAIAVPVGDFPATATSFQPQSGGKADVLVVKIAPDGKLAAATYLGGAENDWAEGVGLDPAGNVYLSGLTNSQDFPVTGGQGGAGQEDAIAVALSADLSKMLYSRRSGGSGSDNGRCVAVSGSTFVFGGQSNSPNWPVSAPAQAILRGGIDGAIAVFTRQP
jgi:hypothetical protein